MSLYDNGVNSYLFLNRKEIYNFEFYNKNVDFPYQFVQGNISKKLVCVKTEKVSFKGSVYDFSINYNTNEKFDILNIDKYLMLKK